MRKDQQRSLGIDSELENRPQASSPVFVCREWVISWRRGDDPQSGPEDAARSISDLVTNFFH